MPLDTAILSSKGLITREQIRAELTPNQGLGLRFAVDGSDFVEAHFGNISSTQRNTVLAKSGKSICLTEHFMAAAALMNLNNYDLHLSQEELPFGDGSAQLWIDFFRQQNIGSEDFTANLELKEELMVIDEDNSDRWIKAIPAANFSVEYRLDWAHPKIGKQTYTWSLGMSVDEIASARTFSSEAENKMLGLDGWIVGFTEDGFSMPLLFEDEPCRHKALDLVGDLYLSGINPLKIKMQVVSSQAGHALNSKLAIALAEQFGQENLCIN